MIPSESTLSAAELAEKQLKAYNTRNIEAFLACYSAEVEVYEFPITLTYVGIEKMRERYTKLFNEVKNLNCEILNRTVLGNYAIDQEKVSGFEDGIIKTVCAIYYTENNQITKVWFIR